MEIELETWAVIGFAILFAISHARAAYWKGVAQERGDNAERENEAQFWRRHFDSDAAEWTTENH